MTGICTDGATAMTGKHRGLIVRVRAVAPLATATHCCIHREQLAVKRMPPCLKTVLDQAVKLVNVMQGHSRRGAALKQCFFLPLRRQQDDKYILCCVKLDNDNS